VHFRKMTGTIGTAAFAECSGLRDVEATAQYVDSHAFGDCVALRRILLRGTTAFGPGGVFFHCTALEVACLPDVTDPGSDPLGGLSNVKSVYMPSYTGVDPGILSVPAYVLGGGRERLPGGVHPWVSRDFDLLGGYLGSPAYPRKKVSSLEDVDRTVRSLEVNGRRYSYIVVPGSVMYIRGKLLPRCGLVCPPVWGAVI
jgi:hypothetical protein